MFRNAWKKIEEIFSNVVSDFEMGKDSTELNQTFDRLVKNDAGMTDGLLQSIFALNQGSAKRDIL